MIVLYKTLMDLKTNRVKEKYHLHSYTFINFVYNLFSTYVVTSWHVPCTIYSARIT